MTLNIRGAGALAAVILLTAVGIAYADHDAQVQVVDAGTQPRKELCELTQNLSIGSRGAVVECLQSELIAEGYLHIAKPTGYFGALTQAALEKRQSARSTTAVNHPYYKELEEFHRAMMAAFMSPTSSTMHMDMPDNRKVIAVVLYDEFEPLDAVGPLEVLGQLRGYKVVTVAKQKGVVASAFGTKIVADYSFEELKHPAIIVVPGGLFGTIAASKDAETLAWLREADKTSEYTTSVCTGAWILGAAGLLNGRQASTHWTGADYLEDFGVEYSGKRYTVDGKYITAAGVSAGIDMSFKLVAMLEGDDAAKVAQLGLEYDPQPPFDAGSPAKSDPRLVRIMLDMMKDHLMAAKMMYGTSSAMTMSMPDENHSQSAGSGAAGMHTHTPLDVSSWPSTPSVSIQMHPDSMGGWNLEMKTQNFRFAPEHVGGAVVAGEGHAHLYIDGVKVARVYGNWYNLPLSLFGTSGSHEVRVTLNANDHSDLTNKGASVQAVLTVTK